MKNKPSAIESGLKVTNNSIQEIVVQLQECWKCEMHTKGLHSPVYCYNPVGSICHWLTHSNIYSWATVIVGFFFSFWVLLFLHIIGRGEGGCPVRSNRIMWGHIATQLWWHHCKGGIQHNQGHSSLLTCCGPILGSSTLLISPLGPAVTIQPHLIARHLHLQPHSSLTLQISLPGLHLSIATNNVASTKLPSNCMGLLWRRMVSFIFIS